MVATDLRCFVTKVMQKTIEHYVEKLFSKELVFKLSDVFFDQSEVIVHSDIFL